MQRELAEDIARLLRDWVGLLEHTVHLAKDHGTGAELSRHGQAAAQVLAALETQVLQPIFAEYPDLDRFSPTCGGKFGSPYPGGAILVERYHERTEREHGHRTPNDPLASARLPPKRMPEGEGLLVKDVRVDKELAAIVLYFFQAVSNTLIHTIWMVKRHGTEEEFKKQAYAVGGVLAAKWDEISRHIHDRYPEMYPDSPAFVGERAIHEGRLFGEEPTDASGRGPQGAQAPASSEAAPSPPSPLPPEDTSRKNTPLDKDVTARLTYIARSCAGLLRHTTWLVKQQGTEEEFVRYKKAMAVALDELQTRLLDPLYAEYPELDPKSPT